MAFFSEFPRSRTYDSDLGWLLHDQKELSERLEGYDNITFADPITWNITTQYSPYMIVRDGNDGGLYISKKPVPAGIQLSNTEYWESLGFYETAAGSDLIINVANYGALGVEDADYTLQIQAAIDAGNYIYFPAGTYSFGTIAVNKPLHIFGEGEKTIWKPLHRTEFSNQYKTMLQSSNDLTIDNITFIGNNSIDTQTGEQYYQTAIVQQYGARFILRGCFIREIYDNYHLSQGDLEFYARNGLFLYVSDADYAEISDCTFGDYGGEELIWISRAVGKFGDAADVIVRNNHFIDRPTHADGSGIEWGTVVNVLGGNVYFNDNIADNYFERGSFVNLLGNNVSIFNNIVVRSDMANVFETCEGYFAKNNTVRIYNNYTEDRNGYCGKTVKVMARYIDIHDNHFEGINCIDSYALLDPSHNTAGQSYKANDITWADYDYYNVSDNEFVVTGNAANATSAGALRINQNNQAAGSRSRIKKSAIKNNIFNYDFAKMTTFYQAIMSFAQHNEIEISGNYFAYVGSTSPSTSRRVTVTFYESLMQGDTVFYNNNIINDKLNNAIQAIIQVAASAENMTLRASYNTCLTENAFAVIDHTSVVNEGGDYNFGFSANFG